MTNRTFYIKTFGCQMNERDSEIMAQTLGREGYVETMDMEDTDLVIINTCSVRAKAEQKVMSLLGYLRRIKKKRPGMKICVAGCVAQQEGERIIDRMPHVDLVVGTQNIYNIGSLLINSADGRKRVWTSLSAMYSIPQFLPEVGSSPSSPSPLAKSSSFQRFVTIMQGCNNYCSYCVVPYTRGREISRKYKDIINEVKVLVDSGVRDITLLGQNVNSYGTTNPVSENGDSFRFPDLLRAVASVEGLTRLRFTTSNPKDLDDGLIACFRELENLCPQLHLPVQSGSDRILRKMNRKYTVAGYLDKVSRLRSARPGITLTTDMIIGFPGETEEDFMATMNLLETVRFDGSFSFKYSDRPGTAASGLAGKVDEATKTARLMQFQQRQDEISLAHNQSWVGSIKTILLEEVATEGARGRTDTNHIVHLSAVPGDCRPGDVVAVRIVHAGQHSLKGECVGA